MAGNSAFAANIKERAKALETARDNGQDEHQNPATEIITRRGNTLANLAAGKIVTDPTEWVDPVRCRVWEHHNRDEAWLNEETCSDLIESIKAEGQQRIPAIVRRIKGDPQYDYEIIAGRRRHWSVSWLRQHNYENIMFLVNIQRLTDAEAFRVADIENRARKDITDLERSRDYAVALGMYFDNNVAEMARRLGVERTWLSKFLEIGRLPQEVLDAMPSKFDVGVRAAATLAPLLKNPETRQKLIDAAVAVARTQDERREKAEPLLNAQAVVSLLTAKESEPAEKRVIAKTIMVAANRKPMMKVAYGDTGALTIRVLNNRGATREELIAAFTTAIDSRRD